MAEDTPRRVVRSVSFVQKADYDKAAERALAAEAKLAEIRSVLLEGGQPDFMARRRALAIIGEEETRG